MSRSAEHGHELIAAPPHDEITGPNGRSEDSRDQAQGIVTRCVAVNFIDSLQIVDVDQYHRHRLPARPALEPGPEGLTRGTAGEGVGFRQTEEVLVLVFEAGESLRQGPHLPGCPEKHGCRGQRHQTTKENDPDCAVRRCPEGRSQCSE